MSLTYNLHNVYLSIVVRVCHRSFHAIVYIISLHNPSITALVFCENGIEIGNTWTSNVTVLGT